MLSNIVFWSQYKRYPEQTGDQLENMRSKSLISKCLGSTKVEPATNAVELINKLNKYLISVTQLNLQCYTTTLTAVEFR